MKIFIWKSVDKCTTSYHSSGGVAVFADTIERARELASKEDCFIREDERPDVVREVLEGEEAVVIFPDAGCC